VTLDLLEQPRRDGEGGVLSGEGFSRRSLGS